jgi:hypothetical protein
VARALNLTARLKQDSDTQQRLQHLRSIFADEVQPQMEAALAMSELVHYARVVVIDDSYLQVLTEFDGDPIEYTEFFRLRLGPIFEQIFSLVEGAPPWEELDDRIAFFEYAKSLDRPALGTSSIQDDGFERGYLFAAYGDATVREIKQRLDQDGAAGGHGDVTTSVPTAP